MRPHQPLLLTLWASLLLSTMPATALELAPININADTATTTSLHLHAVTSIQRSEILASPATHLADLLALEAGIDIRRRGAAGVQADASIRGSNFEQTQVLLNGVPLHNPQTGHHNLDLPIALEQIERIDIIKGPGSVLQDGSSSGGTINIVTRQAPYTQAGLTITGGSHNSRSINGYTGTGNNTRSHLLSFSAADNDAEHKQRPNDAQARQALYTGQQQVGQARFDWGIGAAEKKFGAWGFYSASFPDAREETQTYHTWLGAALPVAGWDTNSQLYWNRHEDWFLTRVPNFGDSINEHKTEITGVKTQAQRQHAGGTTLLGASFREEKIRSNALIDDRRQRHTAQLGRQQRIAPALQAELLVNWIDYSSHGQYWLPSIGLTYQFDEQWRGVASAGRSAREPSYTELYMVSAADLGKATLKPEKTSYYELGLTREHQRHTLTTTAFHRRSNSWLDWVKTPQQNQWQAENLHRYRAHGVDVDWRWQPNLAWLSEARLGADWLKVDAEGQRPEIKYARHIPRQTWRGQLVFPMADTVQLHLQARHPRYHQQASATLLDAQITWAQQQWSLWLQGNNLLDKDVIETGFAPIAGRWITVGASFDY